MTSSMKSAAFLAGLLILACAHFVMSEQSQLDSESPIAARALLRDSAPLSATHHTGETGNIRTRPALAIRPAAPLPPMPPTLAGISHEVVLQVDNDGHLVIQPGNLQLMEFYLAANDEEALFVIRQRIEADIRSQLESHPMALADALSLLDRYWSWRANAEWLPPLEDGLSAWSLEEQFVHIKALRSQFFSATEQDVYFGAEDEQHRFMLATLAIQQDNALSSDMKQQALDELQSSQTDSFRQGRNEVTRITDVQDQASKLQKNGADAEAIHRLRAEALGEQAAQALAELDEKQSAWNRKLDTFSARYAQIMASDQPADTQKRQLDALLESQFDEQERPHAMAYVEFR